MRDPVLVVAADLLEILTRFLYRNEMGYHLTVPGHTSLWHNA